MNRRNFLKTSGVGAALFATLSPLKTFAIRPPSWYGFINLSHYEYGPATTFPDKFLFNSNSNTENDVLKFNCTKKTFEITTKKTIYLHRIMIGDDKDEIFDYFEKAKHGFGPIPTVFKPGTTISREINIKKEF